MILRPHKIIKENSLNCYSLYQELLALIKRLFIQIKRRPSIAISGIVQPLLWLILFGALFQNAPVGLFTHGIRYNDFLSPGIIVFTSFTGSINAGLPIMFDREFGFLNRLLTSPMIDRDSILLSSSIFITVITIIQTLIILLFSTYSLNSMPNYHTILTIIFITFLITFSISSLSIGLAFILPGHIELLACILILNLPMLFSSTALAPLSFMPHWLQIIASINPLSYAIESIRSIKLDDTWSMNTIIMENVWFHISLNQTVILLLLLDIISFIIVRKIISYRFS